MSVKKIAVLISGGGSNLQSLIDGVENESIDGQIMLVVSNKEDAYGLVRAKKAGIKTIFMNRKNYVDETEYNRDLIKELKDLEIDLVVLAGYLRVLSSEFIAAFKDRIINIHPSLIPSFCGKGFYGTKVHQGVLDYGVKLTGATVHFVDEGTDTGPIILQEGIKVNPSDDVESLQKRVLLVEHRLLVEAVGLFCQDRIVIDGRKVIIS